MKHWQDGDGEDFKNSEICYGKEYDPGSGAIDVAKISIRGRFPAQGFGYLEESYEMAVVVNGGGFIENKAGERYHLKVGDVVCVEPMERFYWDGDMDLIVPCGPAFDPDKHKLEDE